MEKNNIKNELNDVINETSVSGEKVTKKAQKVSKDQNSAYYKDVEKKMGDYDKNLKNEDEDAIDPVKDNGSDKDKKYHDEMEIRNGQEMIQYDRDPSDKFKERAEMAIVGDSKMGNKTYTGDENGNTEPVWGASDAKFGEKLVKTAKDSEKKRKEATPTINQFGDDIEAGNGEPKVVKRKIATEGLKRIKFKKRFNGVENAINLIPESFKIENKKFELTDGNEKYLVEWKNNKAYILEASDNNLISEDFNKIKHLMSYKSKETLGTLSAKDRVNENNRIMENATGVAFGSTGNGFVSEEDEYVDPIKKAHNDYEKEKLEKKYNSDAWVKAQQELDEELNPFGIEMDKDVDNLNNDKKEENK